MDPFDCTVIKVDHSAFDLLQFYLTWGNAFVWDAGFETAGFRDRRLDSQSIPIIQDSLWDELHMLSLCSYASTLMDNIKHVEPGCTARVSRKALKVLQARLGTMLANKVQALYDIAFLALAETFGDDDYAVRAHLSAVKELLELCGGLKAIPPHIGEIIIFASGRLATNRLTRPITSPSVCLDPSPPIPYIVNTSLERSGQMILHTELFSGLDSDWKIIVLDLIRYTQVLGCVWSYPQTSPNIRWVSWKCIEILFRLLAETSVAEEPRSPGATRELTRITLLLWYNLLLAGTIRAGRVKSFLPRFSKRVLRSHPALADWNLAYDAKAKDEDEFFSRLVQVLWVFEQAADIQLGDLMQEFFSQRSAHLKRAKAGYGLFVNT